MLISYLFRRRRMLALLVLAGCIYGIVAYLYGLPGEPVFYTILLTAAAGAVFFAFSFTHYCRQCRAVEYALSMAESEMPLLPETEDALEQKYQALVKNVCASRAALSAENEAARRELLDYYTLWVHQIKTPIAAMHLLLQSPRPDARELDAELFKTEQYAEMALSYLRLGSEANDLVLRRQPLDPILRGAIRKYARLFILQKITLRYADTGLFVVTDEKWFAFIVEQLLSNALKYTPKGGSVIIRIEDGALIIADTGIGIRPEDLPRVFEKGFTGYNGRADKKATGLGLYLCRCAAAKLGIVLTASSEAGRGTAMRIGLCTQNPDYE